MDKSLFASKTFWFNFLTGLAALITSVNGALPPEALPYITSVSAVINIGLRLVTDQGVSVLGK